MSLEPLLAHRASLPIALVFPNGWGQGPIFDWYNILTDPAARAVQTIEIQKDGSAMIAHRFVILRMCNGQVHRFDRRPSHAPNANISMVDLLLNRSVPCEDSYILDVSFERQATACEMAVTLHGQVDFLHIISACYAMSLDESAHDYSFFRYNDLFFSRTILMVVSRCYMPQQLPPPENVQRKFVSNLDPVVKSITDDAMLLFRDFVVDARQVIRYRAGDRLKVGMNVMDRLMWALPTAFIRFFWRREFAVRVHPGLRKELTRKIKSVIEGMVAPVQESVLANRSALERLEDYLWVKDTTPLIEQTIRTEIGKVLWPSVLDAISLGFGDLDSNELTAELKDLQLQFSLLGQNSAQLRMVWNAALHNGLKAAKKATPSIQGLSDEESFNLAWDAAGDAALEGAQTMIRNTRESLNNPGRDEMWEVVWAVWSDSWSETREMVRPLAVETVAKAVQDIMTSELSIITEEAKQLTDTIEVHVPGITGARNMTNLQLQEYMLKVIRGSTVSKEAFDAVVVCMDRIWRASSGMVVKRTGGVMGAGGLSSVTE